MLKLENISLEIDDELSEKEILNNINLEVDSGKFIVITGPNGGGKSTLARVIAGIQHPTSGRILFNGEDITDMSITDRARKGISFAFQQPVRFKGITVHDLISLASGKKLNQTEACRYLSEVGLCARDYIDRELNDALSGGEIKRIEIASILARGTMLSIFDEPEAGIDLWSFKNLIDVFRDLKNRINGSIIIISHQERILNIADEIVVLSKGQIISRGPKDDILPRLLKGTDKVEFCPVLK